MVTRVSVRGGHVIVAARFGPAQGPYLVEFSRSKTIYATGFQRRDLVLRAALLASDTGLVRYRTRQTVVPGRYWVAVAARLLDATSCQPILHGMDCNVEWSRPVAVRVR